MFIVAVSGCFNDIISLCSFFALPLVFLFQQSKSVASPRGVPTSCSACKLCIGDGEIISGSLFLDAVLGLVVSMFFLFFFFLRKGGSYN